MNLQPSISLLHTLPPLYSSLKLDHELSLRAGSVFGDLPDRYVLCRYALSIHATASDLVCQRGVKRLCGAWELEGTGLFQAFGGWLEYV